MSKVNRSAWHASIVAYAVMVCGFTVGCSTDFGDLGNFLPCDAQGKCASGYTCAKTDLGAVCLSKAQFKERCEKPEICNGADDNCDGRTDEGFQGLGEACAVSIGECERTGMRVCNPNFSPSLEGERPVPTGASGEGVVCSAVAGSPADEHCDGLDNDCDGETDEDLADIVTGSDIGECQPRIERCVDGAMLVMPGAIEPIDDICDGLDNNCDGLTDEDLADIITGTIEGVCDIHIERCVAGAPTVIQDGIGPMDEACNLIDDDCDGMTDDSVPPELRGFAVGECQLHVVECINGQPTVTQFGVDPVDEICDHRDNDCDGQTDEDFTNLDHSCAVGIGECVASGTYACSDDGTTVVCSATSGTPSAELCDGLDNNCDGATDETFPELGEECGVGLGVCRTMGVRVCREDGFGTQCDAVPGTSSTEICDGLDNDCDGDTNEDLDDTCCTPGTHRACGVSLGVCTVGQEECGEDRAWGACPGLGPTIEACDGLDNNCNGSVDEGLADCCTVGTTVACSVTRGACVAGQQLCTSARTWDACSGVLPQTEVCDGIDNDCDDQTDEIWSNLHQLCSVGRGACAVNGTIECMADHQSTACTVIAGTPTDEICDGLDNDCDGETDEGLLRRSSSNIGECREGIERCIGGRWVVSNEPINPSSEICDGLDNNCDGQTDENVSNCCLTGSTKVCSFDRGECRYGTQTCGADRMWGLCSGTFPTPERCDGLDNNCDGQTDEIWATELGQSCTVGRGICARIGTWVCNPNFSPSGDGERPVPTGASGEGAMCTAVSGDPGIETCDGLDNDCDGLVDEIEDVPPALTGSNVGACRSGVLVCRGGQMVPIQDAIAGSPEVCDNRDNNCDGFTDNDIESVPCYDGPIGTEDVSVCFGGETMCAEGTTVCTGERIPELEICNGGDDDCDGVTDGWAGINGSPSVPITAPCYSGPPTTLNISQCHAGITTCSHGHWGRCVGEVVPTFERCPEMNNLDDDCDGTTDEWTMEMASIPGTTFTMGSPDGVGNADEHPQHQVTLSPFCIDKYETTNAQYRACVDVEACVPPVDENSRTRVGYFRDPTYDQYPVMNVTWYMADIYCRWTGKHLPTEAQWELAARGIDGRTYPWGNEEPTCERVQFSGCTPLATVPVASTSTGASPFGVLHLAGNVSEWIAEWYSATYYTVSPPVDPIGPQTGMLKVFRGGGQVSDAWGIRATRRGNDRMPTDAVDIGIRCVQ